MGGKDNASPFQKLLQLFLKHSGDLDRTDWLVPILKSYGGTLNLDDYTEDELEASEALNKYINGLEREIYEHDFTGRVGSLEDLFNHWFANLFKKRNKNGTFDRSEDSAHIWATEVVCLIEGLARFMLLTSTYVADEYDVDSLVVATCIGNSFLKQYDALKNSIEITPAGELPYEPAEPYKKKIEPLLPKEPKHEVSQKDPKTPSFFYFPNPDDEPPEA
jgi:hypothetical protein